MPTEKRKNLLDGITVVVSYHSIELDSLRRIAALKSVGHWMAQSHIPDEILFMELGFDGVFSFSADDFPDEVTYIRIQGNEKNKYLFQKECLWNIGAKIAKNEKLMFIDSDIAPIDDIDWFKQVCDSMDGCLFTQGFKTIQYLDINDNPTYLRKKSFTTTWMNDGTTTPANGVPGGVYCIKKSVLQQIGYFNCTVSGCGDSLFWCELLNRQIELSSCMTLLFKRDHVHQIMSMLQCETGADLLNDVDAQVFHFYHGPFDNRSYEQREYMWFSQYPWFGRMLEIDERCLMAWKSTSHYFFRVMSQFNTICNNKNKVHSLMKGNFDYLKFVDDFGRMGVNRMKTKDEIVDALQYLVKRHSRRFGFDDGK